MNSIKLFGWASILILLVFVGCRKDLIVDNTTIDTETPKVVVSSTMTVFVLDENDEPIRDVEITLNNKTGKSNKIGVHKFTNLPMNQLGQTIQLSHPDYYEIQKVFYPHLNASLTLKVKLMSKEKIATIQSLDGGLIATAKDARLTLPADGIMYTNGTDYNGPVDVYMRWLNPTSDELGLIMPGNLRAKDMEENVVQLASYGMLAVELESPFGEKLQIKSNKKATLDFPLPSETLDHAPETIPLWYYNTDSGFWLEESEAELVDNRYVGEVSHFSFWNCDIPYDVVEFSVRLINVLGNPLVSMKTRLKLDSGMVGEGFTDSDGLVSGIIPSGEEMTFEVFDLCNQVIYSQEIGPFNTNTDFGDLIVDLTGSESFGVTVSGTLLNCDDEAVDNGGFLMKGTGFTQYVEVYQDGTFSSFVVTCADQIVYGFAYDEATNKTVENIAVEIYGDNPDLKLGEISVCDDIQSGIFITTDYPFDIQYTQQNISAEIVQSSALSLYATVPSVDSTNFVLWLENLDLGPQTIPSDEFSMYYNSYSLGSNPQQIVFHTTCPLEITKYEGLGGVLDAKVECEFELREYNGDIINTSGTVVIKGIVIQ